MKYIVYKIINSINQKCYIGIHKTDNIYDNYMGSGKLIKCAIKKYGRDNFKKEILFVFDSLLEAQNKEIEIVNINFIMDDNNYNISIGGGLGGADINGLTFHNKKHSDESKNKISKSKLGKSYLTEDGKNKIIINNNIKTYGFSNICKSNRYGNRNHWSGCCHRYDWFKSYGINRAQSRSSQ